MRFVVDRIVEVSHFGSVKVDGALWTSGPLEDRSWQWALHSFLPLDCLIATGRAEEAAALIREWVDACVEQEGEFPWHDHATALRLDRLSRMAVELPGYRFSDLAALHASMLMQDTFYSRHTNHGFDQAVSLIIASIAFGDHANASRWRHVGLERLQDEISFAFSPDGVHVENSPGYHAGMLANLGRARAALAAAGGTLKLDLEPLYEGALRFLAWMTRPDRFLVYLGDTTQRRGNVPQSLSAVPTYPMLQYALSGGVDGKVPTETGHVFEKSGYAAYRSRWQPWRDHVHIVMKCGYLSRYHRHDDDLNVLVHAYGEDWLIDSGLYSHNQSDPVRVYMRSAQAHNVPFFPHLKPRRSFPPRTAPKLRRLAAPDAEMAVRGSTQMYPGIRINRDLIVYDEKRFRIRDKLFKEDASRNGFWLFHIPNDKKLTVSRRSIRIRGRHYDLIIRTNNVEGGSSFRIYTDFNREFPSLQSIKINEYSATSVIVFGPCNNEEILFNFTFEKK